ncbi:MAG TPA: hypothetical protein VF528_14560 [Pyrinomonadaceae bacterium]|jgi:hypothetical protein
MPKPNGLLPITYFEINGSTPSVEQLKEILFSYKKKPLFFLLAVVNTFISFYRYSDLKRQGFVQDRLLYDLTNATLYKQVKRKFPDERSMFERIIFHRQQLLTCMKMILLEANDLGEIDLNSDTQRELGKACLILNDLLFLPEQEERLQRQEGEDENKRIRNELFSQFISSAELSNTPDVEYAAARHDEYVRIFDREIARFPFGSDLSLSQKFAQLRNIELKRYLWLVLGVYTLYWSESENPEVLLEHPEKFNISKHVIFSKIDVNEEEVNTFFELTSTDYDSLIELLRANPPKDQLTLQQDFTTFRTYPLVYTRDERDVATCIDFGFLKEKVALGLYHVIFKSLEGHEPDRENFHRRYWGDVFEIYVNDRLREAFPIRTKQFFYSPKLDRRKTNYPFFDGVWLKGSSFVAMEYKGKYLTLPAKYSGNSDKLISELEEKFGQGVRQLAKNIGIVFNADPSKREVFSERDNNENSILQFKLKEVNKVRKLYPLLIIQDFSLSLGFANYHLREMFDKEIKKYDLIPNIVRPFSLITVEDIEVVIPYLKQVTLSEVLERYIARIEPLHTFQEVFLRFVRKRRLREPERKWNVERLGEIINEMKTIFHTID